MVEYTRRKSSNVRVGCTIYGVVFRGHTDFLCMHRRNEKMESGKFPKIMQLYGLETYKVTKITE